MPYTTTPENPVHIRPVDVVWFIWAAATCIEVRLTMYSIILISGG